MELKNCPFCGGKADYDNNDNGYEWIFCGDCGIETAHSRMSSKHERVIEAWNRRASDDLLAALKELADSVDGITVGDTYDEEWRVSKAWQVARAAIARHS